MTSYRIHSYVDMSPSTAFITKITTFNCSNRLQSHTYKRGIKKEKKPASPFSESSFANKTNFQRIREPCNHSQTNLRAAIRSVPDLKVRQGRISNPIVFRTRISTSTTSHCLLTREIPRCDTEIHVLIPNWRRGVTLLLILRVNEERGMKTRRVELAKLLINRRSTSRYYPLFFDASLRGKK